MNFIDVGGGIFKTFSTDTALLELLEAPSTFIKDVRYQIREERYPNDLLDNDLPRVCYYETPSTPTTNPNMEKCWVEVDIYVPKSIHNRDRRASLIAHRIYELLDKDQRRLHNIGALDGLEMTYYNRLPNMAVGDPSWVKYGLVFMYDFIIK